MSNFSLHSGVSPITENPSPVPTATEKTESLASQRKLPRSPPSSGSRLAKTRRSLLAAVGGAWRFVCKAGRPLRRTFSPQVEVTSPISGSDKSAVALSDLEQSSIRKTLPVSDNAQSLTPTPVGSESSPEPLAVVRGKPEWQRHAPAEDAGYPVSNATTKPAERAVSSAISEDELPPNPAFKTPSAIPVPALTPAPLNEANAKLAPHMTREYALGVSATDRPQHATAARATSVSVPEKAAKNTKRKKSFRRKSRQRWVLPHMENKDMPRLFTPPAGHAFERIWGRRDRTEARALFSACTYLESEVTRMRELLAGEEGRCCCGKELNRGSNNGCQCAMRTFLEESSYRIQAIFKILEDRYDSIEQIYIKSREYAEAMARFYEVSPEVIHKLAGAS